MNLEKLELIMHVERWVGFDGHVQVGMVDKVRDRSLLCPIFSLHFCFFGSRRERKEMHSFNFGFASGRELRKKRAKKNGQGRKGAGRMGDSTTAILYM